MDEQTIEAGLQRECNIDRIRSAYRKIKAAEIIQRRRDAEEDVKDLDFNDELMGEYNG